MVGNHRVARYRLLTPVVIIHTFHEQCASANTTITSIPGDFNRYLTGHLSVSVVRPSIISRDSPLSSKLDPNPTLSSTPSVPPPTPGSHSSTPVATTSSIPSATSSTPSSSSDPSSSQKPRESQSPSTNHPTLTTTSITSSLPTTNSISTESSDSTATSSPTNAPDATTAPENTHLLSITQIVGTVVGGVGGIALIVCIAAFVLYKKTQQSRLSHGNRISFSSPSPSFEGMQQPEATAPDQQLPLPLRPGAPSTMYARSGPSELEDGYDPRTLWRRNVDFGRNF